LKPGEKDRNPINGDQEKVLEIRRGTRRAFEDICELKTTRKEPRTQ
jgi:hypothetical protein